MKCSATRLGESPLKLHDGHWMTFGWICFSLLFKRILEAIFWILVSLVNWSSTWALPLRFFSSLSKKYFFAEHFRFISETSFSASEAKSPEKFVMIWNVKNGEVFIGLSQNCAKCGDPAAEWLWAVGQKSPAYKSFQLHVFNSWGFNSWGFADALGLFKLRPYVRFRIQSEPVNKKYYSVKNLLKNCYTVHRHLCGFCSTKKPTIQMVVVIQITVAIIQMTVDNKNISLLLIPGMVHLQRKYAWGIDNTEVYLSVKILVQWRIKYKQQINYTVRFQSSTFIFT